MTTNAAKKILIVDDEEDLAYLLKIAFDKRGYQTLTANNGKSALRLLQEHHIDAVVTDIRMPNGDGVELLENVRAANKEKPVIVMVTGYSDLTEVQAYDKGAQAIFTKPVDRKAIVSSVERFLEMEQLKLKARGARIAIELAVEISYVKTKGMGQNETVNIGQGGMFVAEPDMSSSLPVRGEEIEFKLHLKNRDKSISGKGICRWTRSTAEEGLPRGFGLEFTELPDDDRTLLQALIDNLNTSAFIPER